MNNLSLSIQDFDNFDIVLFKIQIKQNNYKILELSKPKINFFNLDPILFIENFQNFKNEIEATDFIELEKLFLKNEKVILWKGKLLNKGQVLKIFLKQTQENDTIYLGYLKLLQNLENDYDKISYLSYMSHEIRVPIQSIIGTINLLKLENENISEQKELLNSLESTSNNLIKLLNDILDISKIESRKFDLYLTEFNLTELLLSLSNNFKYIKQEKNVFFETEISSNLNYSVISDKQRINQVLMNLINNSIKFTNFGFIKVKIKLLMKDEEKSIIEFSVQDSGVGIPENKISEIFDLYSQIINADDLTQKGTGLGLTIVSRILNKLNSEIKVKSEIGSGSIFYFNLEVKNATTVLPLIPKELTKPRRDFKGKKVLLVEDNLQNQIIAKKLLMKLNLIVTLVENGELALEKIQTEKFDLVLMDLQMPVMDGFTATRKIRLLKSEIKMPTPIIALTATALTDTKVKVLESGMNDYISKPFILDDLSEKIADYIG